MIKAIVYTTTTGTTEWYAKRLGEERKLPVFTLKEAERELEKGAEIVDLGCIRANMISGLNKAKENYSPGLIVGVGLTESGKNDEEVRKANNIDSSLPLFTLQGGYYPTKLHGISKLILSLVVKSQRKSLEAKEIRTEEEERMLSILRNGGERQDEEGLAKVTMKLKEIAEKK